MYIDIAQTIDEAKISSSKRSKIDNRLTVETQAISPTFQTSKDCSTHRPSRCYYGDRDHELRKVLFSQPVHESVSGANVPHSPEPELDLCSPSPAEV